MKVLRHLVKLLLIIGALNWGLIGFFQYNLVADLLGGDTAMAVRVIYAIVGLAGLFSLARYFRGCCCCGGICKCCQSKKEMPHQ